MVIRIFGLAQFQAKESTDIPKEVFDKILVEIKKERITNMASITSIKLRQILKKLRLNKYYEHVPHIINRLSGLPPPVLSPVVEEKLRTQARSNVQNEDKVKQRLEQREKEKAEQKAKQKAK